MNSITGFEMAKRIQKQMQERFTLYKIDTIDIEANQSEPQISIHLIHKQTNASEHVSLLAEQQSDNHHNVHYALFNQDNYFTDLYNHNRSQYVQINHKVAPLINQEQLVPENLYLIQDAAGRPGVDFIHLEQTVDAISLILSISQIFKSTAV
ncbi:hypothetical protein [Nicoliella lavandulae]|uniref:Uncharacterized protein n=1 Tax=Nicoliella lavandulae TaxID=3082954 RepID=A0ABU8SM32_9LACO